MDRFAALQAFVAVADLGSFSEASRKLRLAKSAVSRQVGALEASLGVRLLNRTTRALALTDEGRGYLERARRVLADLDEADLAVSVMRARPRGRLRVSAPMSFGFLHLMPALCDFLSGFPDVEVDIALNDRFVDLVEEGFDVAVRIAALADSSLIAKKLAPARSVICASPAYLKAHGEPRTPDDLSGHACLFNTNMPSAKEWRFRASDGSPWPVRVEGRLSVNNGDALRVAALNGFGLVRLPTFIVGADLQSGALASVLDDYLEQGLVIHAVYPHARHLSPTVRAFVDYLAERFGPRPYWDLVG